MLAGIPVLNLFFESSTRTATSFTLAEQRVGADVISFAPGASSLGKGETIADTAITLRAIGVRVIVVRHHESGFPRRLAESFDGHVINAGDGTHAHPTQALLDLMTLREHAGRLEGLRVAIVGDIQHSRVARSNIVGMRMLGVEVTLVGPRTLLPDSFEGPGVRIERDLDAVLPHVDAIMMLRIQRERITSGLLPSLDDYIRAAFSSTRRASRACQRTRSSCIPDRTTVASSSPTRCSTIPARATSSKCTTACSCAWRSSNSSSTARA